MRYEEPVFRPPSEAGSLILQLTVGCSWNRCTFCAMYRAKSYRVRPVAELEAEIADAAHVVGPVRRVFLTDGDALAAPTEDLVTVLEAIRRHLPSVQRVGIYGDSRAILGKGMADLERLRGFGLGIVYFGVETGDPETLRAIAKGATVDRQLAASRLVREAHLKLSVMVLLGVAGSESSVRHAEATGKFLVAAAPNYAAALTTTVVPGTPLATAVEAGKVELPDRWGMLAELRTMLEAMDGYRGPFHANHASNHLPLALRLPRDREPALALLDRVLASRDDAALRPEWALGL
jgi:radical SAM superfamily enzyme YgiQ (UPF0313 family)